MVDNEEDEDEEDEDDEGVNGVGDGDDMEKEVAATRDWLRASLADEDCCSLSSKSP